MSRSWRGFLAALQFLTRVPVPSADVGLGAALVWMPLVGALLGGSLALIDVGLRAWGVPALLESTLLVVLLLLVTGGLHADGLMDTCDAVFGHATPERRLEIMHDPRVGAFGVMGFVSVLALKISAVDGLLSPWRVGYLILAPSMGRWAIVLMATLFPYGRTAGLGLPLKAAASPRRLVLASLVPLAACAASGTGGVISAALAAASAYLVGRWLLSLLPGLTGDCYGAVCEVTETVVWLSGAALLPRL
jgi:adenosylcobinamide-GDP ribazoletransferase